MHQPVASASGIRKQDIAVIGMSCRFPGARDYETFWENLRAGRSSVEEVPANRWNWKAYWGDPLTEKNKSNSRWGGFLDGVDHFDTDFFGISVKEVERMDPQQRIMLELTWACLEDAGIRPAAVSGDPIGVFLGVFNFDYKELQERGGQLAIEAHHSTGTASAIIANRVSYYFNFRGPSVPIDTACSSSLSAIHAALQSLLLGECSMALAGGINLLLTPTRHISFSKTGMLSPTGSCKTFDERADGYVRGEGAGLVLLKPLEQALADGDHIHGIIKGCAVNHSGKTYSLTYPNPDAQRDVIVAAQRMAGITPDAVGYIEAHGTGTPKGDPIELRGLVSAFETAGEEVQRRGSYCGLGSVKTNIGHLEAAAGIAGVIKVLLSMQHRLLPPLHNFRQLNHRISLSGTPFFPVTSLRPWEPLLTIDQQPLPRRAGVSSFGFGGTNAHVVLEEAPVAKKENALIDTNDYPPYYMICLSAKTPGNLLEKERQMALWLQGKENSIVLADIAKTLSAGREHFAQRTVLIVKDVQELTEKLQALTPTELPPGVFKNISAPNVQEEVVALFDEIEKAVTQTLEIPGIGADIFYRKLEALAGLYLQGYMPDWKHPWMGCLGSRIPLPTYPFTRQGYWVPDLELAAANETVLSVNHPSAVRQDREFTTVFTGQEPFLTDHVVNGKKVLPAVYYLEMVRRALEEINKDSTREQGMLLLQNISWIRPVTVTATHQEVHTAWQQEASGVLRFRLFTKEAADGMLVHCEGTAMYTAATQPAALDVTSKLESCSWKHLSHNEYYNQFRRMGFNYGPAHQCLETLYAGKDVYLAHLKLSAPAPTDAGYEGLHPGIMDAALQACLLVGMFDGSDPSDKLYLPFALNSVAVIRPTTPTMWALVTPAAKANVSGIRQYDVDLYDATGQCCVSMKEITFRQAGVSVQELPLLLTPVWKEEAVAGKVNDAPYARRVIFLCQPGNINMEELQERFPDARFVLLQQAAGHTGERYMKYATVVFETVKSLLLDKRPGNTLVQMVVFAQGEAVLLAGLQGILKTAMLENPSFYGQLISIDREEQLVVSLEENATQRSDQQIRYINGKRNITRWEEVVVTAAPTHPWKDGGVYLITGGTGALGMIVAREITRHVQHPVLMLTGRSALNAHKEALLNELRAAGAQVEYRQTDISDRAAVAVLIQDICNCFGALNGIFHCAGIIQDNYIIRKQPESIGMVLAPKIQGAVYLDEYTSNLPLDCFVLFSSVVGALGNSGQADYATANAFLDAFAVHRNQLVEAQQRKGFTFSINWPLWKDGGMQPGKELENVLLQQTGMTPLETADGIRALYAVLAKNVAQVMVAPGNRLTVKEKYLQAASQAGMSEEPLRATPTPAITEETAITYFKELLSETIKRPVQHIDATAAMEAYGIDSIMVMQMTNRLETVFGTLPKTLFFEYQNIRELTGYFLQHHADKLRQVIQPAQQPIDEQEAVPVLPPSLSITAQPAPSVPSQTGALDIAIIGVAGRYPQADNLQEYWYNLQQGKDCITEIPADRWDYRLYFDADKEKEGTSYSKWGGFINDVDKFDPLFFNISPSEAERMDPQERLFLQCVYETLEDAGYTKHTIAPQKHAGLGNSVGVYVGVMYEEYQLYGAQETLHGKPVALWGLPSSIANRVSYYFDFHGPSMAIDTMCSSSLTAIHLACESIVRGKCEVAIAGGVNVSIHPNKYLFLSQGRFVSSKGRCESFGTGGDGYVPGEGVGAVLLKPLEKAIAAGDHIYGVIKATAINHGGKTNGYTVPNPKAQAAVISRAFREAGVEPRAISYLEAHGTGTSLGDPIEILGLSKAMSEFSADTQFCSIGSVKSNIGHCESAAGIAGVTKVLLQLRYRQIVPSLHSAVLNQHIDFSGSPFYVQQELTPWKRPVLNLHDQKKEYPLCAGISSFGAGGANAHIIIEEYQPVVDINPPIQSHTPALILLSATDAGQLTARANQLLTALTRHNAAFWRLTNELLPAIAYTLQTGREHLPCRLALSVTSLRELEEKLTRFINAPHTADNLFPASDTEINNWLKGEMVDWSKHYANSQPLPRVSLPVYPFRKERYWIGDIDSRPGQVAIAAAPEATLHPLLHRNVSDLQAQRFSVHYTGQEFFLADHLVNGRKILPAAAQLEMTRAAVLESVRSYAYTADQIHLQNLVWLQPLMVEQQGLTVFIELAMDDKGIIHFEIYSEEEGDTSREIYSQGQAVIAAATGSPETGYTDIASLQQLCNRQVMASNDVYEAIGTTGLQYGPSLRGIRSLAIGDQQLLVRIEQPAGYSAQQEGWTLHPGLIDPALQATLLWDLMQGEENIRQFLPFALESLVVITHPAATAWVLITGRQPQQSGQRVLDLTILDEQGNTCVRMKGAAFATPVSGSARHGAASVETLLLLPAWEPKDIPVATAQPAFDKHIIIACGLPQAAQVTAAIPGAEWMMPDTSGVKGFSGMAIRVFEKVKACLSAKQRVFIQLLVASEGEARLYTALAGLLKTARKESPHCFFQVITVASTEQPAVIARKIIDNSASLTDNEVRYRDAVREVLQWRIQDIPRVHAVHPWRDGGVYLITGGAGGLGLLFAREIVQKARGVTLVLTGRSSLDNRKQQELAALEQAGARIDYRKVDITNQHAVKILIQSIQHEFGTLHGILHSAGVVRDNYLLNKQAPEWNEVLSPKVDGVQCLDIASRNVQLDFFIFFSSVTGALGNAGQADYATANAFMDAYAAFRNELVAREERYGHTWSINWPLWKEGGMQVDGVAEEYLFDSFGMVPLPTAAGIQALYQAIAVRQSQVMIIAGERERIISKIVAAHESTGQQQVQAAPAAVIDGDTQQAAVLYFKKLLSGVLKLPVDKIRADTALEEYGIDSVMVMKMTARLEKEFGALSKTLFFEYRNINDLTRYFLQEHSAQLTQVLGLKVPGKPTVTTGNNATAGAIIPLRNRPAMVAGQVTAQKAGREIDPLDIAIIGISGKYPQAENLAAFWENLCQGRDCITEIPADRWDYHAYYDADKTKKGKTYSKWGGFLKDVAAFDARFFNISPMEAELLDPQERLFLQCVQETLEDAGYNRQTLAGNTAGQSANVGVYVGVMYEEYQLFGAQESMKDNPVALFGNPSSIANRISYFYNFDGPSMAVDTMCSSSLTAIHLACQSIHNGECAMAIAGGVNVSIHPNKYLLLAQGRFISGKGRCESFGIGGDGYVPAEGVGAVLLKPLSQALKEGDHVYGVIKATAINHGGRTNGYTVPNPQAQANVIGKACKRAGIDPRTISYVEAHGTGTSLGDPIEIAGLKKAYQAYTSDRHFCAIGSVKSNIGHSESAAGMAGLTKILLQLKHRTLVPTLHASTLNPHIDFDNSPFVVQQTLTPWERPVVSIQGQTSTCLRRAGLSSFGAGGANAHLIIEELEEELLPRYTEPTLAGNDLAQPVAILLSAKNEDRLKVMAARLEQALQQPAFTDNDLANIAFTLQVGREALETRLAIVVQSLDELRSRLQDFVQDTANATDVYYGKIERDNEAIEALATDEDLRDAVHKWIAGKKYSRLCALWVKGLQVDWTALYQAADGVQRMRRLSLPAYPFAQDRYWVPQATPGGPVDQAPTFKPIQQSSPTTLLLQPVWTPQPATINNVAYASHFIVLAGLEAGDKIVPVVQDKINGAQVVLFSGEQHASDNGYAYYSLQLFRLLQRLLQAKPAGKLLLQVVVVQEMLTGLQALLQTAQRENPLITGQLIRWPEETSATALAAMLLENKLTGASDLISYLQQTRKVLRWQEYISAGATPKLWKEGGRYLITGGAGGLGIIFAREIIQQLKQGTIILTGRAPADRRTHQLAALQGQGVTVLYKQADITQPAAVAQLMNELQRETGGLDGIIHSAGITRDNFLIHKTEAGWQEVTSPKIAGLINLDEATKDWSLDFFIAFSSVAGALGNPGQADYACANAFMDQYMQFRGQLVDAGQRRGISRSINWPLWKYGGMQVDNAVEAQLQNEGMWPIETAAALHAFYLAAAAGGKRLMVLHGDKKKLQHKLLLQATPTAVSEQGMGEASPRIRQTNTIPDSAVLLPAALQQLKTLFGQVVKLDPARIDAQEEFQAYGLNSVMIVQLNQLLEKQFGDLSKTLFYEHPHLASLAKYLVQEHPDACRQWCGGTSVAADTSTAQSQSPDAVINTEKEITTVPAAGFREPIAIIGLSGCYPMASNLEAFWHNLRSGKDCITEIPADRWPLEGFFEPDKDKALESGKSYSKWGGFLDGFAHFDPLFFNISPREANTMDPQERLFLQACWQALEDGCYTKERIAEQYNGRVGVFAGITKTGFELYGPALNQKGEMSQLRTSFSSVANRVSWHLNLHGPSMPIDTMCSSSLVAIHEACDSILLGHCDMALAGGVNLYLHPLNYIGLCSQSFLAVDGRCRSFGEGGSGFVPGEGVGVVLLKRLSQAIADGDPIHAIIKGSSVNHGGKTSGYTVPNPVWQASLIREALNKAGVPARAVSYIEAHGTGTSLGDPIEITGLSKAFRQDTADHQFCAIGSVKSNIGHLEAAAGVAGITKIILQMKHGLLAPSLHAEQLNSNIQFHNTPFYVQRSLGPWERPIIEKTGATVVSPRIAGISSFGAGGANAHVIIGEYIPVEKATMPLDNESGNIPAIIVLSARNKSRLKEQARQLLAFISNPALDNSYQRLLNIAYTLQTGREAMEERWAAEVLSISELQQNLKDYTAGETAPGVLSSPYNVWLQGETVNWENLYAHLKGTNSYPVHLHMPAYPFEPTTYWLPGLLLQQQTTPVLPAAPVTPKDWLITTEEWEVQELPGAIDWNKRLQYYAGKRICIIYEEEQEIAQLTSLLQKLEKAGGLLQPLTVIRLPLQEMQPQQFSSIRPEVVLFLGPLKRTTAAVQPVADDLKAVYQCIQYLMQAAWDETVHLYYFYETTDGDERADMAALPGLFRSAMKENPQHIWKSVQLHNATSTAARCQLMLKEWLGEEPGTGRFTAVRYVEGKRCACELVETVLPQTTTTPFRKKGNYLIAGGMGYIGSTLLRELVTRYQANLAILSKGEYDEERKQLCEQLRNAGVQVQYYVCDITDITALRRVFDLVKETFGTIHGVINLTRRHDSKGIVFKSWESFYEVSSVKIKGTINLDILTQDEPLDLFMLFASIGAYGARGDADYAFSVAFQNAFARYRRTLQNAGKRKGVSISQCWGPWIEDRLFPESRKKMHALGLDLITMEDAFPLIEASCFTQHAVLGLCAITDKEKIKEVLGMPAAKGVEHATVSDPYEQLVLRWEQLKKNGQPVSVETIQQAISIDAMKSMDDSLIERIYSLCFDNDSLPVFQSPAVQPAQPAPDLLPALRQAATEVLQVENIEDTKSLQHYGLDSIMAMRLSNAIAKKLSIEMMPKWLIEFPSLQELANHLHERMLHQNTVSA